jgi:hypothetical protein
MTSARVILACLALAAGCKQQKPQVEPDRSAIKQEFGALYADVLALLFKADPVGINFKDNTDEYEPEVDTILPRLSSCKGAADVEKVVHEEFVRWFDRDTAGPPGSYRVVARQIWERYKAR